MPVRLVAAEGIAHPTGAISHPRLADPDLIEGGRGGPLALAAGDEEPDLDRPLRRELPPADVAQGRPELAVGRLGHGEVPADAHQAHPERGRLAGGDAALPVGGPGLARRDRAPRDPAQLTSPLLILLEAERHHRRRGRGLIARAQHQAGARMGRAPEEGEPRHHLDVPAGMADRGEVQLVALGEPRLPRPRPLHPQRPLLEDAGPRLGRGADLGVMPLIRAREHADGGPCRNQDEAQDRRERERPPALATNEGIPHRSIDSMRCSPGAAPKEARVNGPIDVFTYVARNSTPRPHPWFSDKENCNSWPRPRQASHGRSPIDRASFRPGTGLAESGIPESSSPLRHHGRGGLRPAMKAATR